MSFISHCYNDRKESLLTLLHLVSILLDYELPRYPIIAIDGSDDIRSFGKTHQTALIQIGHLKSIQYRTVESYDIATIAFQIIQMQIAGVIIDTGLTRTYRLIADRPGRGRERFTIEFSRYNQNLHPNPARIYRSYPEYLNADRFASW